MKLVIYHWNSCGHCIRLFESLNKSGDWEKSLRRCGVDVEIIEYTEDEERCVEDEIRSFPTIRLYSSYSSQKKHVTYTGERNLKGLKEFITQNGGKCNAPTRSNGTCKNGRRSCPHH